jgi:hypothetical protein
MMCGMWAKGCGWRLQGRRSGWGGAGRCTMELKLQLRRVVGAAGAHAQCTSPCF